MLHRFVLLIMLVSFMSLVSHEASADCDPLLEQSTLDAVNKAVQNGLYGMKLEYVIPDIEAAMKSYGGFNEVQASGCAWYLTTVGRGLTGAELRETVAMKSRFDVEFLASYKRFYDLNIKVHEGYHGKLIPQGAYGNPARLKEIIKVIGGDRDFMQEYGLTPEQVRAVALAQINALQTGKQFIPVQEFVLQKSLMKKALADLAHEGDILADKPITRLTPEQNEILTDLNRVLESYQVNSTPEQMLAQFRRIRDVVARSTELNAEQADGVAYKLISRTGIDKYEFSELLRDPPKADQNTLNRIRVLAGVSPEVRQITERTYTLVKNALEHKDYGLSVEGVRETIVTEMTRDLHDPFINIRSLDGKFESLSRELATYNAASLTPEVYMQILQKYVN